MSPEVWASHHAVVEGVVVGAPQYETDRAKFLGRGRELRAPLAMLEGRALSGTTGTVLDPVFALRYRLRIPSGGTARIAFWTCVASDRHQLLEIADKHRDPNARTRTATLAWTQGQVQLRHFGIDASQANLFQQLAGHVLFASAAARASADNIRRGAAGPEGLWSQAISGDLPIVLLRVDDIDDLVAVRQLLQAHEYWGIKRLAVDLVILNERGASYVQDLQVAIEAAVRTEPRAPAHRRRGHTRQGVRAAHRPHHAGDPRTAARRGARRVSGKRGSLADQVEAHAAGAGRRAATARGVHWPATCPRPIRTTRAGWSLQRHRRLRGAGPRVPHHGTGWPEHAGAMDQRGRQIAVSGSRSRVTAALYLVAQQSRERAGRPGPTIR
jgi:cyclic beta-1,2-glucan synthetase